MTLLSPGQQAWRKLIRLVEEEKSTNIDGSPKLARKLYYHLLANGWQDVPDSELYSYCSKANVEYDVCKGPTKLNIIAATFIGEFIDLTFTQR